MGPKQFNRQNETFANSRGELFISRCHQTNISTLLYESRTVECPNRMTSICIENGLCKTPMPSGEFICKPSANTSPSPFPGDIDTRANAYVRCLQSIPKLCTHCALRHLLLMINVALITQVTSHILGQSCDYLSAGEL